MLPKAPILDGGFLKEGVIGINFNKSFEHHIYIRSKIVQGPQVMYRFASSLPI